MCPFLKKMFIEKKKILHNKVMVLLFFPQKHIHVHNTALLFSFLRKTIETYFWSFILIDLSANPPVISICFVLICIHPANPLSRLTLSLIYDIWSPTLKRGSYIMTVTYIYIWKACVSSPCRPHEDCAETRYGFACRCRKSFQNCAPTSSKNW